MIITLQKHTFHLDVFSPGLCGGAPCPQPDEQIRTASAGLQTQVITIVILQTLFKRPAGMLTLVSKLEPNTGQARTSL